MNDRPPVNTKKDFVRRYQNGEFGNASPTWDRLEEWLDWCYSAIETGTDLGPDQLYHIRNRIASGPTYYDVAEWGVVSMWHQLLEQGAKPKDLYLSAMAPTALTLFQGEVYRSINGVWMIYSTLPHTMREALAKQSHIATGIMAIHLLRRHMCDNSYAWLEHLLETYHGHVVEFSVYSKPWGTVPYHNTVFWEVRNY